MRYFRYKNGFMLPLEEKRTSRYKLSIGLTKWPTLRVARRKPELPNKK